MDLRFGGVATASNEHFDLTITDLIVVGAGSQDWSVAASAGDILALADASGSGMSLFTIAPNGSLSASGTISDSNATFLDQPGVMQALTLGGRDFLLTASTSEFGLSCHEITSGQGQHRDSLGPDDGLGIMVPTAMELVTLGGHSYALLASAAGDGGAMGAISVVRIGAGGQLVPTDHVLDTLETRFGQVQCLTTVEYRGHVLVLAGGGDDGVSLFELTSAGRLVHLDSFADTVDSGLDGVTDLAAITIDQELQVYAASGGDRGLTLLTVDLSDLGLHITAGAGGAQISGSDSNDLLQDGSGADTLWGGDGHDIFVITFDNHINRIQDFDPARDRIDLSLWPLLYDVNDIVITSTATGARIEARGQTLIVQSASGGPLSADALRAAIRLDLNHGFFPPEITHDGHSGSEDIIGSWGTDTLRGAGGNDTLRGDAGDDLIDGGSGHDVAVFSVSTSALYDIAFGQDRVTITSGDGVDILIGIESFQFTDTSLDRAGLEQLIADPPPEDLTMYGTEGHDNLVAGRGNDLIIGDKGNDTIRGNIGHDDIWGSGGDDYIIGGWGNDTLHGGRESDSITGGGGDDSIVGQRHGDTISGGSGDDTLKGGGGSDWHDGEDGDDFLKGGTYNDTLIGGSGDDLITGNRHDDLLIGGAGRDSMNAGGQDDTLTGGSGNDTLKGGGGADVFIFDEGHGYDIIRDFTPSEDILELSADLTAGRTAGLIVHLAQITSAGALLRFGNGDEILLEGLTSLAGVSAAIDIV